MTGKLIVAGLLITGAVNTAPVIGLFSSQGLQALYGAGLTDPGLLVLMRHRALLFALLGGFVLASIAVEHWRLPAMTAALISMLGFLVLAWPALDHSPPLAKIFRIDAVACLALIPAIVLQWLKVRSP